jgi:hypothetical protein
VSSGWGAATTGQVWTPVSTPSAFSTTGTAGQISIGTVNTARQIRTTVNPADVDVVFDASVNSIATGSVHSFGPMLRVAGSSLWRIFATLEFGLAGALSVRVRTYVNSSSSTTLATIPVTTYAPDTPVRCRVQVFGDTVRMRAWAPADPEPATWALNVTQTSVTGSNAVMTAADVIGLQASVLSGSTSPLPVVFTADNVVVSQLSTRLTGYVSDVRPVFVPQPDGSTWSTVQVDISGVGSKLEKNEAPAWSPMRRSIQLASTAPVSYWPLEDAEGSTSAASALPGQAKMLVSGPAVFSFDQGTPSELYLSRYGTRPIVSVAAGARLTARSQHRRPAPSGRCRSSRSCGCPAFPGSPRCGSWNGSHPAARTTGGRWWPTRPGTPARLQRRRRHVDRPAHRRHGANAGQITYTIEAVQSGSNVSLQVFYNSAGRSAGRCRWPPPSPRSRRSP